MRISQNIHRLTIQTIEDVYLKNCQPKYVKHWNRVRARLLKELLEDQLRGYRK
jgi:hypothetical protein